MKKQEKVEAVTVLAMALLGMVAWWMFYVKPQDQFLYEVLGCMHDVTEAEYARCVAAVENG